MLDIESIRNARHRPKSSHRESERPIRLIDHKDVDRVFSSLNRSSRRDLDARSDLDGVTCGSKLTRDGPDLRDVLHWTMFKFVEKVVAGTVARRRSQEL